MNVLLVSLLLGFCIGVVMVVTRSRDDADKAPGAYIVKCMIVVCPIIFLGLTYISIDNGGNTPSGGGSLEMRTGIPDF